MIFSEADEARIEQQKTSSDGNGETNECEAYPSTLDEARKRNRKIIEVCLLLGVTEWMINNFLLAC